MIETLRAVAHPWLCDVNNHLNTRHYQGFFDDAAMHLYAECGFVSKGPGAETLGVADVKCEFAYIKEVRPGGLIVIRSGFLRLGGKSMTSRHEMVAPGNDDIISTCITTTVFFDLAQRRSAELPAGFRAAAADLLIA